ncbi:carbohydrate kinase family protein [Peribacillus loiseleuriae]|uniref:Carbohydrate kinase PfkB domain-containing protein n=1 Tax=Peribacillus loiseleuriae TaxID=1679170 RepID=A0A0K9GPP9_9BACI|nr:carbohydrate kinase family protein [Peribacillus loiseleuriae]KMY48669.1 hypothetical protein AC625_03385 [Peribacillus loiseleuriae]
MVKVAIHGFINIDIIGLVDKFTEIDQETKLKNLQITPGGSAANVAVGLSRLGEEVYFLGAIGDDIYTSYLLGNLENTKLDYVQIIKGKPSGTAMALVDGSGLRTMYTYPGANENYNLEIVPQEFYEEITLLHLSSPDSEVAESFFQWKEENINLKISLDPSTLLTKKGLSYLLPILLKTDILFVNRSELNDLFPEQNIDSSIRKLHELGIKQVFIKLGKEGALSSVFSGGTYKRIQLPALQVEAIDSTGSGDAFAVGALYGIIREWPQELILQTGINLGGRVVSQIGSRKGLPLTLE